MKQLYQQILEEIGKANNILLVTHKNPDGDALGSLLSFVQYLENTGLSIDIDKLDHNNGVSIIRQLSSYQQDTSAIPETILGYEEGWK